MKADFTVQNEGSIFLLRPHSQAAHVWITEHMSGGIQQFGSAAVIDYKYIYDVINSIQQEGLLVR
jgi:hypothetical protein